MLRPGNLYVDHSRERALTKAIKRCQIDEWDKKKILDVGCGGGSNLINLLKFGAKPSNLYGVDIQQDRIDEARQRHPTINFQCTNAERLPFDSGYFDIVMQYTVFVAIDDQSCKRIAEEMGRVLRADGLILWYDFRYSHPFHRDERGIGKKALRDLFPNFSVWVQPIVIPPVAARLLGDISLLLCETLERIPILCSAYFAVLRRTALNS